eukprot:836869_1
MARAMMNFFKLLSAYTIIAIFSLSAILLLVILTRLVSKYKEERKDKAKQKPILVFMSITITAIVLFEISLLLVIVVCVQIILIDAHDLHQNIYWIDDAFYNSFEFMEYAIAICDTGAHLCVVFAFISRYHHTFHNNTIFYQDSGLVRALYICASILTAFACVIVILICIEHTIADIIILEIVWEVLVDFMCLWVLYLFLSKLYSLLKLSVQAHMESGRKTDFVKELIEATKASIEQSKSGGKKGYKSRSPEPKSMFSMTIDGMKVDPWPLKPAPNASRVDPSVVSRHMELTVTKAISDHEHTDNEHTDNEEQCQENRGMKGESAGMDLIGVMTKMTILVTFTVLVSVIGVIGNVFIEIQELKYIDKHDITTKALWADVLPVIDIVITSLMLYLQFNFTQTLYRKVLGRFDVWFLRQILKCIEFVWNGRDERTSSFLVETKSSKTLEKTVV